MDKLSEIDLQAVISKCEGGIEMLEVVLRGRPDKHLRRSFEVEMMVYKIALAALEKMNKAPDPTLNDAWKLVPVEPTWEMLSADGCTRHHDDQDCMHHKNRKRIWQAMLAAAPDNFGENVPI